MKTMYRIEHKKHKRGMWYNKNGKLVDYLKTGIPMPKRGEYLRDNKTWYSCVESLDDLRKWFDFDFTAELIRRNFRIIEFKTRSYQLLDEHPITSEMINIRVLDPSEVYEDLKGAHLWTNGDLYMRARKAIRERNTLAMPELMKHIALRGKTSWYTYTQLDRMSGGIKGVSLYG